MDDEAPSGPVVEDWLYWVWRAFWRLDSERTFISCGMAGSFPQGIPYSAIVVYAEHHGLSPGEMKFLDSCIVHMDEIFRDHWSRKMKKPGA